MRILSLYTVVVAILLASCSSTRQMVLTKPIDSLRLINVVEVPYKTLYKNTVVGGLSGIDYVKSKNRYYLICDDRSNNNPARFYTAKIKVKRSGIQSVQFKDVVYLRDANDSTYPQAETYPALGVDPEAMRYNALQKRWYWSSEGERITRRNGDTVLVDPSINIINKKGVLQSTFPLPERLRMHKEPLGPRQNGTLEGMCFANDYKTLYATLEEPLYEDGPRADTFETQSFIRIFKWDVASQKPLGEYAYKLERVALNTDPPKAFRINGIPDVLYLGTNKLLIIERSFSTRTSNTASNIKVFEVTLDNATDITNIPSLTQAGNFITAAKKLVLDMDSLGIFTDNIEGVTFGPTLPNGHQTLLFVADNNFSPLERTQFLLFEIL
jgi:hypothetical protein